MADAQPQEEQPKLSGLEQLQLWFHGVADQALRTGAVLEEVKAQCLEQMLRCEHDLLPRELPAFERLVGEMFDRALAWARYRIWNEDDQDLYWLDSDEWDRQDVTHQDVTHRRAIAWAGAREMEALQDHTRTQQERRGEDAAPFQSFARREAARARLRARKPLLFEQIQELRARLRRVLWETALRLRWIVWRAAAQLPRRRALTEDLTRRRRGPPPRVAVPAIHCLLARVLAPHAPPRALRHPTPGTGVASVTS